MIGALLKVVLIVVVIAAAAAFFLGYRLGDLSTVARPAGETRTAPAIDTEKARETGANIGEAVATGAIRAKQAVSDSTLTARIKSKMALDDTVDAAAINVDTVGSTVTLSGTVRSEAERTKALQLARETNGVTSVTDRLVVR
jgi:hyperosmotically inducible periplasmic protein